MIGTSRTWRTGEVILGVLLVLFAIIPFVWMVLSSLAPLANLLGKATDILIYEDYSLDAYWTLLNGDFLVWIGNSLVVIGFVVLGNIIFDSLAAYPLARMDFRGKDAVLGGIVLAIMIPAQVIAVPLYLLMRDFGWLNTYQALILPYLASPTGIFLLRQHYMTLPKDFEEAAAVDGAGFLRTFFSIIVPNSAAAIATVALLKFVWTWGEFAWPSLVITSDNLRTVPVGLASFQGQFDTNWPLIMAGSTIAALPPILLFIVAQRWFVQGMTAGAVKG